eukprot:153199_1
MADISQEHLKQIISLGLGFKENDIKNALFVTDNVSADAAIQYLFEQQTQPKTQEKNEKNEKKQPDDKKHSKSILLISGYIRENTQYSLIPDSITLVINDFYYFRSLYVMCHQWKAYWNSGGVTRNGRHYFMLLDNNSTNKINFCPIKFTIKQPQPELKKLRTAPCTFIPLISDSLPLSQKINNNIPLDNKYHGILCIFELDPSTHFSPTYPILYLLNVNHLSDKNISNMAQQMYNNPLLSAKKQITDNHRALQHYNKLISMGFNEDICIISALKHKQYVHFEPCVHFVMSATQNDINEFISSVEYEP